MLILISGASGSGKSAWAEQMAVKLARGRLLYLATMLPHGEEGCARVERHRQQRRHLGFITIEKPAGLSEIALQADDTLLLEDVSNLLSNSLFSAEPRSQQFVLDEIRALSGVAQHVLAVSISGLKPRPEYDEATNNYIAALNWLNGELFALADAAFELKDGQALPLKGECLC